MTMIEFPAQLETKTDNGKLWKPDDDQIALRLVPQLVNKVAFFHGEWKVYENGCWRGRDMASMRRYIRKELREMRDNGVAVSQNRIRSIAAMLEDDLSISDVEVIEKQRQQWRYVNLRNGLFNLETFELEDHKPEMFFTSQMDFDYNADANCPTFKKYLQKSLVYPGTTKHDWTLYRLVMQALGYSMTARTDLQASFWLVGAKASGKSTFVNLIKMLMGTLHTTVDLTQLGVNRFLLSGIVGKRVITFTEGSSNSVLPDGLYKALIGGQDDIQVDVKNRDPITFRPAAKLWWAMNDGQMPRITDRSGATARRLYIIPFNRTIPEKERDGNLEHKLYEERSGIFNETLVYYKRLLQSGTFEGCEQSEHKKQEYIEENDTESRFVEEMAERHESYSVQSSILYLAYNQWCKDRGFHPKNELQVGQEWRRLGFTKKKNSAYFWEGLRLRDLPPIRTF
jgi:putative DNA primase/helicase